MNLNFAIRSLLAILNRAKPVLDSGALELRVIDGVHAGAAVILGSSEYTVGSNPESAIVLRDAGVASVHARLRRQRRWVDLEGVDGDVVVNGRQVVPMGNGRRCSLPFTAAIGGARVLLTDTAASGGRRKIPRALPAAVLLAAGCVVLIAANGLSFAEVGGTGESDSDAAVLSAGTGRQETLVSGTMEKAAEQLRARLADLDLDALSVEEADGRLIVSGTVPASQSAVWSNAQAWFDQKFGADVVFVSKAVIGGGGQAAPRLTLQAIWHGERPYIIGGDGTRYHEGAFTNDGWMVKHIADREMVLEKGGARFALKYP